VPGLGWGVVVERPVAAVVAATRGLRDLSFAFLLLVAAVAAAGGVLAADRLSRPLRVLAGAAERLAGGDATAPLPASGIGEVAALTAMFGGMRDRLGARTAERERATEALRESEARKDAILRTALDAVLTVDEAGRVVDLNPAAEDAFGHAVDEAVGRDLVELIAPPLHRADLRRAWARAAATDDRRSPDRPAEVTLRREDGSEFRAEVVVSPIRVGGARMFTAFVRDVTDRRAAEAERARRLAHEEVARAKDELVSVVGHELRSPLAALRARLDLQLRRLDRRGAVAPEELRDALVASTHDADRLARLLALLLDTARTDAGKLVLAPARVDVVALAARVVGSTQLIDRRHRIALVAPPAAEAVVDPTRVEQVLTNLLENAVKFGPRGSVIEVEVAEAEGGVRLAVRDAGPGVPEDRRAALFERGAQAHGDGHRGGLGLGLYVARAIVAGHGGRIWAEFPPEGGTRVVAWLPRAPAAA
jgi:PAS domain S-box-containing protein